MMLHSMSLERLYADFDAIAVGQAPHQNSTAAHQAVLSHLAENSVLAEASGWTSLSLGRLGGTGRVHLEGTPPSGRGRGIVPDLLAAPHAPSPIARTVTPVSPLGADARTHEGVAPSESESAWLDDGGQ